MKKGSSSKIIVFLVLVLVLAFLVGCGSDAEVTPTNGDNGEGQNSNSRTNPAGLNETFVVQMDDWLVGKVKFEVEMIDVKSGDEAWQIIKAGNMFNDPPGEGKEYIMAKFRIKVLETEEDEAFDLMFISFSAISGSGVEYSEFVSVAGVEPDLYNDLYEGAEHEGWKFFIVDEDDENPVAAMERRGPAEIWFDLRP